MQPPNDILVCYKVTFRPHTLCYLLNHFSCGVGVSIAAKKHMEIEAKIRIYSALKFGMSCSTHNGHILCVMTILTDKAAQVINQLANCIKFMATHRIYK